MRPVARDLHILWVNRHAGFVGGAERYIHDTARELKRWGVRSTLLYDAAGEVDATFLTPFEAAFPLVDAALQLPEIGADLVYAHQLDAVTVAELVETGAPVYRFLHDHAPFCPREHKFSLWTGATCTKTVGLRCVGCTGGVVRKEGRIRRARVAGLFDDLYLQQGVAGWVVGSHYMAEHAIAHGLPAASVHVVPLFSTPVEGSGDAEPGRLLYIGALNRGKGVDLAIEALVHLPRQLHLTLVGDGPARDALAARAETLGVTDRVAFRGKLPGWQVRAELDRADLLVVPSRTPETFSLVGVEAASRGVPSVAAQVGGIESWLQDGLTGRLVAPNDARALADGIRDLALDRDSRTRMGIAARRRWDAHFRPEHHATRLLELFDADATPTARTFRLPVFPTDPRVAA